MSDEIKVEVHGLDELQAAVEKLSEKAGSTTIRAAVRAGATIIRNAMVNLAPKRSGLLAEHFDIKTKKQGGEPLAISATVGPNGRQVIHKQDKGKTAGLPRTALFITRLLEFGGIRQAKKPFMTQAFESYKSDAFDAMVAELKKRLGFS